MEAVNYNKKQVKEIYEQTYATKIKSPAAVKDEHLSTVIRFNNLLKKFQISIPTNANYIDIACGDGIKTNALSQYFNSSLGVDFSKNAIEYAQKTFGNNRLKFQELDLEKNSLNEQFDLVTSFGNSLFNISDDKKISREIIKNYRAFATQKGTLILGSFTDFSGTAPSGWYNLTREQLNHIASAIKEQEDITCQLYFPHQDINNYLSGSILYTAKELQKLLMQKRRYFYIVIKTKQ